MVKHILLPFILILLLSGCTVDPAAFQLIPTPVPEQAYQPCEAEREGVYTVYDEYGSDILVRCGDLAVDDLWLRDWAENAITSDGARRLRETLGKDASMIEVTAFYMNFFLEADRSCREPREELASLIKTYAEEFKDREHIDFPLLAATNVLWSDLMGPGGRHVGTNRETSSKADRIDCSDKFAALSAIPNPPPLCFSEDPDAEMSCFNDAPTEYSVTTPSQCSSDEAMITPGQTVTDDASDALAAHIDITAVTTALSGETLTVVFHLRDVPETLTFDRTGVAAGIMEYNWEVSVDVDNDLETGFEDGFDYALSASRIVVPSKMDRNIALPLRNGMLTYTWLKGSSGNRVSTLREVDARGRPYYEDVSLEVSKQENTITLIGEIPGITSDSRLAFRALDYLSGSDTVGCPISPGTGTEPDECDSDEAIILPGQTVTDDASDALAAHIDITEVRTALSGETLTVVFHLRDVPESLTFDRTGIRESSLEYYWEVSIDVDSNQETGPGGFEYTLSAIHFVRPSSADSNTTIPIGDKVLASTWKVNPGGGATSLENASIEVSTQANTITLTGDIPGITADSRLAFQTYDFWSGFDEVGCPARFSLSTAPDKCNTDEAMIAPGQTVTSKASDTLPAYIDITGVNTALWGETLTAVFHLRDVPQTLTFDRTGIGDRFWEYSWEVSIDVDPDPEASSAGFDYKLSASHSVHPGDSGKNTAVPIGDKVQAHTWKVGSSGDTFLEDASIEVSTQANTITLTGDIPGITAESRLVFSTYDFRDGSDRVACHIQSSLGDVK